MQEVSRARAILLMDLRDDRKIFIYQAEHLGMQIFKFTEKQVSFRGLA
jgi:hypothetical protein